ncbi:MAG: histidine triad nucleotide-binding protein [Patescibacteria group bacterium]|nr:histidine triad nucleotide-binding protein [Patescibacteria group bacterium]
MACIFCKIINKQAPADIVYQDDKFIAIKDIRPKAPIHLLIIPKKHIPSLNDLEIQDKELMGDLLWVSKKIAKELGIADTGYKLLINVGQGGGQMVDHIHLHLLSGWKSEDEYKIFKV